MTAALWWLLATPPGLVAFAAVALWLACLVDRAAEAAAGFATYGQPPYATWHTEDGDQS